MQQGHPRHKQLRRARHEMVMHKRHCCEITYRSIKNTFIDISKALKYVFESIPKAFGAKQQKPIQNVDYEKAGIKDIAMDMFTESNGLIKD